MKRRFLLFGRARRERELDEELRLHLELETEANRARGMGEAEARAAARRTLGGVALVKDEVRDSWGTRFLDSLAGDIRIGVRGLRKSRGFTAVVVLTLALGIGTNTAIFSVVNGVLLAPLPYADSDGLVRLKRTAPAAGANEVGYSPPETRDLRSQTRSFVGLAEYHTMHFHLIPHRRERLGAQVGKGEPRRVQTGVVSADFLDVLGVQPMLGRGFAPSDDAAGAPAVLLLSHGFWQRAYGGDPTVVGQSVEMNDRPHVIIGVLPQIPIYPDDNDVYMPTSACPFRSNPQTDSSRVARMTRLFGRLAPGVSLEQAQAEIAGVSDRMRAANPADYTNLSGVNVTVAAVAAELTEAGRLRLFVLLAVAGFVLLIVCANVANLTLARGMRREHEMAVRAALGADRMRLLRHLMTEGIILALMGGAVGLLFAAFSRELLVSYAARFSPRAAAIDVDGVVAMFALAVSILTGVLFAAIPALPERRDVAATIREEGARGGGPKRGRLRAALVVAQVAFSFMLLIGAGLMIRSLLRLQEVDPGFKGDRVLTMRVDLDWSKYLGEKRRLAVDTYQRILAQVEATPGVKCAAVGSTFPLSTVNPFIGQYQIEGRPSQEGGPRADTHIVSPHYFTTIGVRLIAGRFFEDRDGPEAPQVLIVNQTMARRQFPGEDPLGRRLTDDDGKSWYTIVGVVGDVKQRGLDVEVKEEIYVPLAQNPSFIGSVLVRTDGDPGPMARGLTAAVHAVAPNQPVSDVRTLDEVRAATLASPRLTAMLLGLFAALALAITAAGLGGVIALTVTQRTHEIAVRMALGARRSDVVAQVLRHGVGLVLIGLVLGAAGALALGRLIATLLYEIEPTDPATFIGVALVLVVVAILAGMFPARRAAGIDPMVALRAS